MMDDQLVKDTPKLELVMDTGSSTEVEEEGKKMEEESKKKKDKSKSKGKEGKKDKGKKGKGKKGKGKKGKGKKGKGKKGKGKKGKGKKGKGKKGKGKKGKKGKGKRKSNRTDMSSQTVMSSLEYEAFSQESTKDTSSIIALATKRIQESTRLGKADYEFQFIVQSFRNLLDLPDSEEKAKMMEGCFIKLVSHFENQYKVQTTFINKIRELFAEKELGLRERQQLQLQIDKNQIEIDKLGEIVKETENEANDILSDKLSMEEKIVTLQDEITDLQNNLRQEQESPNSIILKIRAEMLIERNIAQLKLDKVKKTSEQMDTENQILKKQLHTAQKDLKTSYDKFITLRQEYQKNQKIIMKTQKELHNVEHQLSEKARRWKTLDNQFQDVQKKLDLTWVKLKVFEDNDLKIRKERETAMFSLEKQTHELTSLQMKCRTVNDEKIKLERKLNMRDDEVKKLKGDVVKLRNHMESSKKAISSLEALKKLNIRNIEDLNDKLAHSEKELELFKADNVEKGKEYTKIEKINLSLSKKCFKFQHSIMSLRNQITQKDVVITRLRKYQHVLINKRNEVMARCKKLSANEQTQFNKINGLTQKTLFLNDRIDNYQNEMALKTQNMTELNAKLTNESKLLVDTQVSLIDFKSKYYNSETRCRTLKEEIVRLNNDIEGQKEERKSNEAAASYRELELSLRRLIQERFQLKRDLIKQESQVQEAQLSMYEMESKSLRLWRNAEMKVTENGDLKKNVTKIKDFSSALKIQLTHKVGEIALLQEKNALQECLISRGIKEYEKCVEDMKLLKRQICAVAKEKGLLEKQVSMVTILRRNLLQVEKQLRHESERRHALEQELVSPKNHHRWRLVGGVEDITKHELTSRNNYIQSQLMKLTLKLQERDSQIAEYKQQIQELKSILGRQQTNLQLVNQTKQFKSRISALTDKHRSLTAQLNMYENFCSSYLSENKSLKEALRKYKMKDYEKNLTLRKLDLHN